MNVAKVLLQFKIDADAVDTDGNTALHFAAENGYKEIIGFLLESGCRIKRNKDKQTPIHDCSDESHKKIFYMHGFKEDGEYEQFGAGKEHRVQAVTNKVEHSTISSVGMTPDSFIYFRLLGKGSFGEVFLVQLKGDESRKLYAMKVLSKY